MSMCASCSMTALRHQPLRRGELAREPVEHDLVLGGVFGVAAVLVVARAAREVRALRMHARQRAVRNAVAVHVEIAMELLELLDLFLRAAPCRDRDVVVVPLEIAGTSSRSCRCRDRDITMTGVCSRSARSNGVAREVETLFRIAREQAARAWCRRARRRRAQDVALLRARRHAGGGPDALDVEQHRRAFRRSTRGRGTRSSARCRGREVGVNARAPFQLAPITMPMAASSSSAWMNAKFFLPVSGSMRSLSAERLERVHHRRRRRDRIPRADRRAGVHAAEAGGGVAVDEDVARGLRSSCSSHVDRQRAIEVLLGVVVAELDAPSCSSPRSAGFLRVGLRQQLADLRDVDVEQRREHAGVADVLHQDARAHAVEVLVAQLRQRHAEHGDVVARQQRGPRPGASRRAGSRRRRTSRTSARRSRRSSRP